MAMAKMDGLEKWRMLETHRHVSVKMPCLMPMPHCVAMRLITCLFIFMNYKKYPVNRETLDSRFFQSRKFMSPSCSTLR